MVQRYIDIAVLRVVIAADVVSDPSVFWLVWSPSKGTFSRRFGKRSLAEFYDERVAVRRIVWIIIVSCSFGHPEMYVWRIRY